MSSVLMPYVLIMIVSGMACLFIAVYVWPQRRKNSETIPLVLLMVGITEWIVAALLGLLDQNLAHKILWAKIEYIGVVSVPLAVLAYVLHHSGSRQQLTAKRLAWLAVIPVVTLLLAWTNEYHGLIWARYIPYLQYGLAFSEKTYGPGFWIYWGYSYLLLLVATILIIRSILASAQLFRWQSLLVGIGILAPWASNLLYILKINPVRNLDLTPLAFGITGLALAIGMFRWHLFDIKPIAEAAVVSGMVDGLIILDNQGRILEVNPAGLSILGLGAHELIGKPMEEIIANLLPAEERAAWLKEKGIEIHLINGGEICTYELEDSPFYEKAGSIGGRIIFLHDVTERNRLEERLREAERKQAEDIKHENEQRLASIYNTVADVIYYLDVEPDEQYSFSSVNQAFGTVTGLSPEQVIGRKVNEIIPEPSLSLALGKYRQAITEKTIVRWEETSDYPSGRLVGEVSVAPVFDVSGRCIHLVGSVHDITERKQSELKIQRLNRHLRAISDANQISVRATDESSLLTQVCRCIVETGGYRIAWVGFAEHDPEKSVRPAARYGLDEGYLETIKISWGDNELGQGPSGTAIRIGKTVIAQNLSQQSNYEPWRQTALQRGFAGSIALPLISEGQCLGALNIYSGEPWAFDAEEIKLLEELASDLVFGLSVLRTRAAREQAEQALRESEDKFKHVFENSVNGKSITQTSGEMEVNQSFCDMLGYSRAELINRRWQEITHPEDVKLTQAMINSLISGKKEMVRFTKRYLHKNGSVVWADVGTTLRRDMDGQPLYLITSINDITERMLAEEKLQESEARHQLIFEHSGTANTIFDMDCRVVLQNSRSRELTVPADAHGKTALEVFGPDQGPVVNERMRRVLASGLAEDFETKFSMPAGTRWIRSSYQPFFNDKHAVVGIQVISQDISVQKQAEEALQDYNTRLTTEVASRTRELTETQEKLVRQEKLAVLGQLAGSVGHELRNPLGVINNAIYYLKLIQPEADEKIRKYHGVIEQEVHNAEKIISDLLDFARSSPSTRNWWPSLIWFGVCSHASRYRST